MELLRHPSLREALQDLWGDGAEELVFATTVRARSRGSRSASSTQREVLQADGRIIGSASYIAPERILGELVDARADLYALGCILYECVTGSPPFSSRGWISCFTST